MINEIDVLHVIDKLKNTNISGVDISNKELTIMKHYVVSPLAIIINQSIKLGFFPDKLKIAKVKPLYKKK